jgi:N-acyl-D-aspartate/D-glutamate deacylase
MPVDLLVTDATVVDGTGAGAYTADIAVHEGRIVEIGRLAEDVRADDVLPADGLTATPGFIDIHTHYDAQLHWDPTASPASWHGVTTIFTGNCGFTFAPADHDDVRWLLEMLSRVEGMSAGALQEGVDWNGGSFDSFLRHLEPRIGVNVAANVGHCALRRAVMGDDASERPATAAEIDAMCHRLREAFRHGAVGFTSSQLDLHVAHDGRGVPSNHAEADELIALARVVGEARIGAIEFIPRTFLTGYDDGDRVLMRKMAAAAGVPLHLNTLAPLHPSAPDGWQRSVEFARSAKADGLDIHPMFAANRQGAHFSLGNTFLFDDMTSFREVLTAPHAERLRMLADGRTRDAMRADIAAGGTAFVFFWPVIRCESVVTDELRPYVGMSVTDIAAAMGGSRDELDAFLDVSIADDLQTQFGLVAPPDPKRRAATEELIRDPLVMAGSSDGGAHLQSFCGADYTTRLLTEWTSDAHPFEAAVARLTSIPAHAQGLRDRGVLRTGARADILLIDRDALGTSDAPRYTEDLPAGSGRYVCDATGYHSVIVNGTPLLHDGEWFGATPGQIIRGQPR